MNHADKFPAPIEKEHLFSPHTAQCIYCGQSAEDDRIENTPCNRPACEACEGKGWLFTDTGNDQESRYEIQRCDACELFESDIAAINAVEASVKSQPELLKLVREIAELPHEGEPDEQGKPYEPTSEDAIATLNQLIMRARALLGTAETCDECGESVPYIIGCPGGAEICQDCFDAGL